jgi:hypothetical protein
LKKLRFWFKFKDSIMDQAIKKMRDALRTAVVNLKQNSVKCILQHHLYELNPSHVDEMKLLPKLELQIGSNLTMNYKMVLRTHTRPYQVRRQRSFSVSKLSE